jgi:hypothetical protein
LLVARELYHHLSEEEINLEDSLSKREKRKEKREKRKGTLENIVVKESFKDESS